MAEAAVAPTKKDQIALKLERWFPSRVVASGGFTAIAKAVGASKPLVTTVARDLGFEPEQPYRRTRKEEGCKHCGSELEPGKRVCADCRELTLACDTCGQLFKRPRDRVFERERDPRYQGRTYCSRRCFFRRTQHGD